MFSPKVRIPEGGVELDRWIYRKARGKSGQQPPVSIIATGAPEQDLHIADADTKALRGEMGAGSDKEQGPDDEVHVRKQRSEDPKTWKADDELGMFGALQTRRRAVDGRTAPSLSRWT